MNKLSKEKIQRLIVVGVVTLIVIGGLYAFVIRKQMADINKTRKQIEEMEQKIEVGNKWLSRKKEIEQDLDDITKKLKEIESGMAAGDHYLWFDSLIKNFQLTHGKVRVPRISRPENVKVGVFPDFPYQAVKYIVQGTAYYHDLGKFVADFENEFKYMRLQNLELRPVSALEASDPEKLEFSLEIVTLVKPIQE